MEDIAIATSRPRRRSERELLEKIFRERAQSVNHVAAMAAISMAAMTGALE
ncbi:hypothetical protein [Methylobacterium tarhaniae]|uniref:hypothetical protein n=1 Tax=Methylobacterium tarhaniae TaxID=1187852 RepID=UPI000A849CB3|nr:hypothetical protein [Methylobacterium tarhaniae]